jgi:predicted aspartyl protease
VSPLSGDDLRGLYDAHQWFTLRQAVQVKGTPTFFRGAVACAFNDSTRAVVDLGQVIRSAPDSDEAYAAHELLVYVHWRAGRYGAALADLNALSKMKPDAPDVRESRNLFAALAQFPEQTIAARRYSKLRYSMSGGNFCLPIRINGQAALYVVDTGANLPVISAGEAKRRKLKIAKGEGTLGDSPLYSVQVGDVAMADELAVGNIRIKNVSFLVIPDDRFADIPPDQCGILGLPVLLAFNTLRWNRDGTFEIALPATGVKSAIPNVYFDGAMPVTQVDFGGRKLDFSLDTGATETDLYPSFAANFNDVIKKAGRPGVAHKMVARGSFDLDSVVLPELNLCVGGFAVSLRPAHVLQKDVGPKWYFGNLGMDLLSQGRTVTIDFRRMTLALN